MPNISAQDSGHFRTHHLSSDTKDAPLTPGHLSRPSRGDQTSSYALDVRTVTNSWSFEIFSWLLATVSTVILLIVLATFRHRPVSHWHSNVSLNTVVNVVSQIAQTAILVPVAACISQLKWLWARKDAKLLDIEDINDARGGLFSSLFLLRKRREKCEVLRLGYERRR